VWEAISELAELTGESEGEIIRRLVNSGLLVEQERRAKSLEYENKLHINTRLKAKRAGALQAIENLEQIIGSDGVLDIMKLREWLSKG
jgi:hypothetical protein